MSSIKNVGAFGGASRNDPPPKIISVGVPGAKPTREQVAEAVFRGYGFDKKKDAQFLKENFKGTDPVAHLARTLKYDPRSTTADGGGAYKTRVKLSAADHDTLRQLAAKRGAAATQTGGAPPPKVSAPEARAVKSLTTYDHAAQTKERLQRQSAAPPKPENKEGVGAFFKSVVAGDFDENDSWSATAGKVIGGLNPLADVRDIAAGVKHVAEGKEGAWVDLSTSALGAVPVVGDAGKALIRGGRKVAKEAAEEVAERTAGEAASAAARSTPELRQGFREMFGGTRYNEYAQVIEKVKTVRPELKDIPTEDLVAIRGYTSDDYRMLNSALRSGDAAELKRLEPYIKVAESGLSQLPDYKGVAFRGTNLTPEQAAQYVAGEVRIEPSFFSTAAEEAAAFSGNTKFYVDSVRGKDVSILSEVPREKEILFPPGTRFKVVNVEIDPVTGTRYIDMREVPKGGQ